MAIKGIRDNGYSYIERIQLAIKNGASCIICEQVKKDLIDAYKDICFIIVNDSLKALQDLARYRRNTLKKTKIIGITGSIGKTTVRELIKLAVGTRFKKIFTAIMNYNNEIGCPLTIANTPIDTECLILELGMRKFGDIDFLAEIAKPNIAIITKISSSHIGNFNNIEDIVRAKTEIFNYLDGDKIVILNKLDKFFDKMLAIARDKGITNVVTIGEGDADICLRKSELCADLKLKYTISVDGKDFVCRLNSVKKHDAINSLFAIAVVKILCIDFKDGIDFEKINRDFNKFIPIDGHGNFEQRKIDNKIVYVFNDCYNSNPDSLRNSIITLHDLKKIFPNSRAVAIIGDMLELGKESQRYHLEIVSMLTEYDDIDYVVCIGDECKVIFDNLPRNFKKKYFKKTDDFAKEILSFIKDNDLLLFKASHGMHFANLIEALSGKR